MQIHFTLCAENKKKIEQIKEQHVGRFTFKFKFIVEFFCALKAEFISWSIVCNES